MAGDVIKQTMGTTLVDAGYRHPCDCAETFPHYACHYIGPEARPKALSMCVAECPTCGATWTEIDEWEEFVCADANDAPPDGAA